MAHNAPGMVNLSKLEYSGALSPNDIRGHPSNYPFEGDLSAQFDFAKRNHGGADSPGGYSHLFGNNTPTGSPDARPRLFSNHTHVVNSLHSQSRDRLTPGGITGTWRAESDVGAFGNNNR